MNSIPEFELPEGDDHSGEDWDTEPNVYEQTVARERLEAMIFSAREYVVPSPDLRTSTVELAEGKKRLRSLARRLSSFTLIALVLWCLSYPVLSSLPFNFEGNSAGHNGQASGEHSAGVQEHWAVSDMLGDDLMPTFNRRSNESDQSQGNRRERLKTRSSAED